MIRCSKLEAAAMMTMDGKIIGTGVAPPQPFEPIGLAGVNDDIRQARLAARRERRKKQQAVETPEQRDHRLRAKRESYARNRGAASARSLAKYYTDTDHRERVIAAARTRYAEARAAGCCTAGACNRPALAGRKVCETHWWARAASNLKLGRKAAQRLREHVEAHQFRCFYSGLILRPGVDLSFDHRIARTAEGFPGYECLSNIVPCHRNVNIMKNNLPEREIVEFCVLIGNAAQRHRN